MNTRDMTGLRERKKRATTNAIEHAAVHLALERGHSAVTVNDICARADVSRSTFFNHMPTREAAIFGRPITLASVEQVEAVLAHSADVPITTALLRILFLSVGHTLVNAEVAAARLRLSKEQPDAESLVSGPVTALLYELSAFLEGYFGRHPERRGLPDASAEREAGYLVSLTGVAFRALVGDLADDSSKTDDGMTDGPETDDTEVSEAAFEAAIDEIVTLAGTRWPNSREGSTYDRSPRR